MLALQDTMLPWELDADSLETKGPCSFENQLPFYVPFTAHPKRAPDTGVCTGSTRCTRRTPRSAAGRRVGADVRAEARGTTPRRARRSCTTSVSPRDASCCSRAR